MLKQFAVLCAALCAVQGGHAAESAAYKLASIDAGHLVDKSGIEVQRAEAAMASVAAVCGDASPSVLAGRAVTIANMLMKDGIYAKPVEILEGAHAVFAGKKGKHDCTDLFARYAQTRKDLRYSHSQAVASWRVLQNAVSK